jgi:hypothetical protein
MSWAVTGERPQYARAPASIRPQDQFIPGYSMPPLIPTPSEPVSQAPTPTPTPTPEPQGESEEARRRRERAEEQAALESERKQSARLLAIQFANQYGIGEEIANEINSLIEQGYRGEALTLALRQTNSFKQRFQGNELLRQKFPDAVPYSPAEYIQLERSFEETFNRYNLRPLATRANFAQLIGGRVSPAEAEDRVVNVYDRIVNADTALKQELKNFFPTATDSDFAYALLTGEEGAASLKRKFRTAEIATEAGVRGLSPALLEDLTAQGITREQAAVGFESVKRVLPRAQQLGSIYSEDISDIQKELEQEQFLGMESQRRKRLKEKEEATFQARTGMGRQSFARETRGLL